MDNQNQNQQTPPGCIVAFAVFFVIAAVVNIMTDSIMLSMLIGGGTVGIGTALVLGLKTFWEKADKKKLKKWSIIVISGISAVIIVICIANACIPALSQEEVKKLVIAELDPQTEEVKSELNISDVTIDLDIFDYEYEKPTVFSRGYIRFEVDDYYVSNEFSELDDEIYTAETCSKYRNVPSLEFDDIKISGYKVFVSRRSSYSDTDFKDKSGDEYSFRSGKIVKNGSYVYGKSSYSSSSGSSKSSSSKCSYCGGSGKCLVTWYSEGDWGEKSYSSYTCTYCNGTGRK